jgi:HEAT repeat protein
MTEPHAPAGPGPSPVCRAFLGKLGRTPDKERRRKILAACAKVAKPWAEELLWEALADPNEGLRELVVRELCRREPLRFELALRRLRLPPWYARSAALGIVGRCRVREAVPDIVLASADANAEVRRAAAVALGELGGEEALRHLVRLKKDANSYVRAAAEEAIAKTSGVRFI